MLCQFLLELFHIYRKTARVTQTVPTQPKPSVLLSVSYNVNTFVTINTSVLTHNIHTLFRFPQFYLRSVLHLRIPSKTPHLIYLSCLLRLLLAGTFTRTLLGRYPAVPSPESVSCSPRDRRASERKPAQGKRHFRDATRAQTVNTTCHRLPL